MVRAHHTTGHPPRLIQKRQGADRQNQPLRPGLQPELQALRLDRHGRFHLRETRQTMYTYLWDRTLETYWSQFHGLEQRLESYNREIAGHLAGADVVNLGIIDNAEKAVAAGHAFRQSDVDLIFLHVATYALSSTVLPVVRHAKVPVILLNLSPQAAIDYEAFNRMKDRTAMTGEWLAHCQACSVPEISNVFRRCKINFHQVTGMLDRQDEAWAEIQDWLAASKAIHGSSEGNGGQMLTLPDFAPPISSVENDSPAAGPIPSPNMLNLRQRRLHTRSASVRGSGGNFLAQPAGSQSHFPCASAR